MSYEKQTWTTGDTITAEKLNHMENGIENNGPLVVNVTESEIEEDGELLTISTLDKTWQEISDAFPNVYVFAQEAKIVIYMVGIENNEYTIVCMMGGDFSADSPNDYPTQEGGGK